MRGFVKQATSEGGLFTTGSQRVVCVEVSEGPFVRGRGGDVRQGVTAGVHGVLHRRRHQQGSRRGWPQSLRQHGAVKRVMTLYLTGEDDDDDDL